jgi:RPA family protein
VVTPTGARVNRLFAVGVLTEVEDVNPEMVRGRIVDPTGAFVSYAGQYQPDELAFLERADPPSFVALSGKARTFEPDDGDRVFSSVRPESTSEVDAETRDRWVVATAERTLERIGLVASAIEADLAGDQLRAALREAGVDDRLADGIALALEFYDTTPAYLEALQTTATDAAAVVAGEREEVGGLDVAPDEGVGDASALSTLDLAGAPSPETAAAAAGVGDEEAAATETETAVESEATETADDATETAAGGTETSQAAGASVAESGPEDVGAGSEPEEEVDAESVPETPESAEGEPAPGAGADGPASDAEDAAEPADLEPDPTAADDPGEFDADEFELDEEKRREVEEEYGTEFSTAGEVEEAGIDTPAETEGATATESERTGTAESASEREPTQSAESTAEAASTATQEADTPAADAGDADAEAGTEADTEAAAETDSEEDTGDAEAEPETGDGAEPEPAAESEADAGDVDLEDAVVAAIDELDDGDGASREALVETVTDEHGVAAGAVEDAIQDALMSGQCYEPSEGVLKSI